MNNYTKNLTVGLALGAMTLGSALVAKADNQIGAYGVLSWDLGANNSAKELFMPDRIGARVYSANVEGTNQQLTTSGTITHLDGNEVSRDINQNLETLSEGNKVVGGQLGLEYDLNSKVLVAGADVFAGNNEFQGLVGATVDTNLDYTLEAGVMAPYSELRATWGPEKGLGAKLAVTSKGAFTPDVNVKSVDAVTSVYNHTPAVIPVDGGSEIEFDGEEE